MSLQIFWSTLIIEGSLFGAAMFLIRNIGNTRDDAIPNGTLSVVDIFLRLDPVGIALCVPGLVLLILGITSGNTIGWNNASVITAIATAVALLIAFILFEASFANYPLVPRYLWTGSNLAVGCILAACTYGVWHGANYILTLQLQGKEPLRLERLELTDLDPRSRLHSSTDCSLLLTPWNH